MKSFTGIISTIGSARVLSTHFGGFVAYARFHVIPKAKSLRLAQSGESWPGAGGLKGGEPTDDLVDDHVAAGTLDVFEAKAPIVGVV